MTRLDTRVSVETLTEIRPEIRSVKSGEYCVIDHGVPATTPGVVLRFAMLLPVGVVAWKCSIALCNTVSSRSVVNSPDSLGRAAM